MLTVCADYARLALTLCRRDHFHAQPANAFYDLWSFETRSSETGFMLRLTYKMFSSAEQRGKCLSIGIYTSTALS